MIQFRHPVPFARRAAGFLLVPAVLFLAGCASTGGNFEEAEALYVEEEVLLQAAPAAPLEETLPRVGEGEVPLSVAASEPPAAVPDDGLTEIVVEARVRVRHEVIRDLVYEARALLEEFDLEYRFTGRGRNEILRGRPVAFALWSESAQEWTIARIEIPRPPIRWRPGGKPIAFTLLTPGVQARHVKGTGAERLMFSFSRDGEPLKVYGRKFPVFDSALLRKKQWRAVARTARPIVYLPFTEDTLDPLFVSGGREYLLATAQKALDEVRLAKAPGTAFPGELLADIVSAEVLTALAVIEQTDDADYVRNRESAFNQVLSHYGLKREEAYRYSVSTASALGPMQFTNRRGNGTYAMVVRRCPLAKIDPNFERGATNLLNAMKAAICLFDIELSQMRPNIRNAYRDNMKVLGIFPVAAYNGGPRNVRRLYDVMTRMRVKLEELRMPGEPPPGRKVTCPCLWKAAGNGVQPVSIPRYNTENRGYVEKYLNVLSIIEREDASLGAVLDPT